MDENPPNKTERNAPPSTAGPSKAPPEKDQWLRWSSLVLAQSGGFIVFCPCICSIPVYTTSEGKSWFSPAVGLESKMNNITYIKQTSKVNMSHCLDYLRPWLRWIYTATQVVWSWWTLLVAGKQSRQCQMNVNTWCVFWHEGYINYKAESHTVCGQLMCFSTRLSADALQSERVCVWTVNSFWYEDISSINSETVGRCGSDHDPGRSLRGWTFSSLIRVSTSLCLSAFVGTQLQYRIF